MDSLTFSASQMTTPVAQQNSAAIILENYAAIAICLAEERERALERAGWQGGAGTKWITISLPATA